MNYVILIPVFNDWDCLDLLIPEIDKQLKNSKEEVQVLIINDGSTKNRIVSKNKISYLKKVEVLNLKKNVKAQIAIATGLEFLKEKKFEGGVIVMDGDGQDDPKQLIDLIQESKKDPKKTITVNRSKREEEFLFKILYQIYLFFTFFLTFKYLKFGVYSYLHFSSINKILSTEDVYMAYVAGLAKHFKKRKKIYAARKKRIVGKSQNNYKSLIFYALKIISVFRYQALINTFLMITAGTLLIGFEFYFLFFMFILIIFNIIFFLIPYKIKKNLLENPLLNAGKVENFYD